MSPTTTGTLSAECTVAREDGYKHLHSWCRQTRDIPLPHSKGRLLLVRPCPCHKPTGRGEP